MQATVFRTQHAVAMRVGTPHLLALSNTNPSFFKLPDHQRTQLTFFASLCIKRKHQTRF